eukprot:800899-Prorocentrum_minimum.AAC.1
MGVPEGDEGCGFASRDRDIFARDEHTIARNEHTLARDEHTIVGGEHTIVGGEHTIARNEHLQLGTRMDSPEMEMMHSQGAEGQFTRNRGKFTRHGV